MKNYTLLEVLHYRIYRFYKSWGESYPEVTSLSIASGLQMLNFMCLWWVYFEKYKHIKYYKRRII